MSFIEFFISFGIGCLAIVFTIIILRMPIAWTEFQISDWRAALKALFTTIYL